jgi:hypothetical protein
MKLSELLPGKDSVQEMVLRAYLIETVFGGQLLGGENDVTVGPVINKKVWAALSALNVEVHDVMAKILEMEQKDVR